MTTEEVLSEAKLAVEIRKLEAEADVMESEAVLRRIRADREESTSPESDGLLFYSYVDDTSVFNCIGALGQWSRRFPKRPLNFTINSGGGSILDGLHLFDFLRTLSSHGHHITTRAMGYSASMAGVLLQAGDHRVMSPNALLLIHEGSMETGGNVSELEDNVKWLAVLNNKLVKILAERSTLTPAQIRAKMKRRDYWLEADEALKYGFVDEVS